MTDPRTALSARVDELQAEIARIERQRASLNEIEKLADARLGEAMAALNLLGGHIDYHEVGVATAAPPTAAPAEPAPAHTPRQPRRDVRGDVRAFFEKNTLPIMEGDLAVRLDISPKSAELALGYWRAKGFLESGAYGWRRFRLPAGPAGRFVHSV